MILATTRRRAARRAAFTLLEVLVVVAILVILAGVATVATTKYLDQAKKNSTVLQCRTVQTACENYFLDPNSNGQYPTSVQQLINPPWGGGSLLRDPQKDAISPWGHELQIQTYSPDGSSSTQTVMVTATANDGTKISNFGTGNNARW